MLSFASRDLADTTQLMPTSPVSLPDLKGTSGMPFFRLDLGALRRSPDDPIERTMRSLERQGGTLVRVAHVFATLMIVLFSLGSLVALSGDAVTEIVTSLLHGGIPSIPKAISVVVSTLLVVCCDVGLVYAAMVIRALRTRGAASGYALHVAVFFSVSVIEAGTYLYMSARWEQPAGWAWALIVARAAAAPLLSVYLSMATQLPITSRDILHQAELFQGIQLVRDVLAVAADPTAPLADKMELYEKSAVMTPADRERLGEMIAVVKRRQLQQSAQLGQTSLVPATHGLVTLPAASSMPGAGAEIADTGYRAEGEGIPSANPDELDELGVEEEQAPALRYNGRRLMDRLGVAR
jgi:hypothetical protein